MGAPRRVLVAAGLLSAGLAGCPALLSDPFHLGGDASAPNGARDDSATSAVGEAAAADGDAFGDGHTDAGPGSEGDATASDTRTPEDATLAPDAPDATVAPDASPTTGSGACCSLSQSDPLDQGTFGRWIPRGTARGVPGYAELTADVPNQSGAVFWPTPETGFDFDVAFDFSITKASTGFPPPGDGLAFVAVADVVAACTSGGSSLCLVGATKGLALVFRTYAFAPEPSRPYVALVDTSRSLHDDAGPLFFEGGLTYVDGGVVTFVQDADAAPPPASWQTACLRVLGGRATVHLGGQTLLSDVPVSGPSPIHWGFVGATGSASERSAVRNVRWSFASACADAARCSDAGLCGPLP